MRPLECAAIIANVVALLLLGLPQRRLPNWLRYLHRVAPLAIAAQAVWEGQRSQLVPVDALGVSMFLVWLLRSRASSVAPARPRRLARTKKATCLGLGLLAAGSSATLTALFPVFSFEEPSGPYAIGTLTYHWVDQSRPEVFTSNVDDRREMMAQVWYPADPVGFHNWVRAGDLRRWYR